MTTEQRTTLAQAPQFQQKMPAHAATWLSDASGEQPLRTSLPYRIGRGVHSALTGPTSQAIQHGVAFPFSHGRFPGALAGGAMGGVLGYGAGTLAEKLTDRPGIRKLVTALGMLGGAGLGYYSGKMRDKSASADADDYILESIQYDSSLTPTRRAQLTSAVLQLSDSAKEKLKQLLMLAGGATAGAVIAKFLGGGLMATGVGVVVGAAAGSRLNTVLAPSTLAGDRFSTNKDIYGNRYLL